MKMSIIQSYQRVFRSSYDDNSNLNSALEKIKKAGASMRDSVLVIKKELCLSIADADKIVIESRTWKNEKQLTMKVREQFLDGLEKSSVDDLFVK